MIMQLEPGDCRDVLLEMAARRELFDAVITDPPYHLTSTVKRFGSATAAPTKSEGATGVYARASRGFMGKTWDGGGVAFDPETWAAVLEVMKPGAHLVAFGGSRTFHRMAVAIEDAGFEIRDSLMWVYGTGFPKSHDVARGIDRHLGAEPVVTGRRAQAVGFDTARQGGGGWAAGEVVTTEPATAEAAAWRGWGSALKPAVEPIILARKPFPGSISANVLEHGTGALNIDACRIEAPDKATGEYEVKRRKPGAEQNRTGGNYRPEQGETYRATLPPGRWPANLLHDGSPEVLEAFAAYGDRGAAAPVTGAEPSAASVGRVTGRRSRVPGVFHNDTGSAARFFYSAKAGEADRAGSGHPTVKPLALMRWLCRLITPPGGRVLDPFAGSGTTLQAAAESGFSAVGIEREAEYQADILRRIAEVERVFAELVS